MMMCFDQQKTSFIPDDAFEKLDPDTSLTRGFVFTTVVDADERYVTFTYTYNLDSSASAGYYYLADDAGDPDTDHAVRHVADDVTSMWGIVLMMRRLSPSQRHRIRRMMTIRSSCWKTQWIRQQKAFIVLIRSVTAPEQRA